MYCLVCDLLQRLFECSCECGLDQGRLSPADLFLVFVLYDIHVVCDSVIDIFSSHFVIQMIVLLLFLFTTKQ